MSELLSKRVTAAANDVVLSHGGLKSNYERLFGTPERAARTIGHVCQFTHGGEMCERCRLYVFNECDGALRLMSEQTIYDALLEWLRGDAE